jgi:predicted dienelactone hydrolase
MGATLVGVPRLRARVPAMGDRHFRRQTGDVHMNLRCTRRRFLLGGGSLLAGLSACSRSSRTGGNGPAQEQSTSTDLYDPFLRGRHAVGVITLGVRDASRDRLFPIEVWYPAAQQHAGQDLALATQDVFDPGGKERRQEAVRNAAAALGTFPVILFSHSSGGGRYQSTFLCTHLSSHGYVVAAPDHSELFAADLRRPQQETAEQRAARIERMIESRPEDIRFVLSSLLGDLLSDLRIDIDRSRVGLVGHSFGGWSVLATPDGDARIAAIVALAPGGGANPKPGILPLTLEFNWKHPIPTLYLVAENDAFLPLPGIEGVFARTPSPKRMAVLRKADHFHFMDDVEELHEGTRRAPPPPELEWMSRDMRPMAELSSGEEAHIFTRGLTLAHLDAALRGTAEADAFFRRDLQRELAKRGVSGFMYPSEHVASAR